MKIKDLPPGMLALIDKPGRLYARALIRIDDKILLFSPDGHIYLPLNNTWSDVSVSVIGILSEINYEEIS